MMSSEDHLKKTFHIFEDKLQFQIKKIHLQLELGRIQLELKDGTNIYVQFNDFGEYGII